MRVTLIAALAGAVGFTAVSCQRDFDSPYIPGSANYAGDDWTRDGDGDGIADSLEKYAPGCRLPPNQCLANAKLVSSISGKQNALYARDMLLWLDDAPQSPGLDWTPAEGSIRGYVLTSSDSTKVRPVGGRLQPMAIGSAQIYVTVPGADSLFTNFIAQVAVGGKKVQSVSVQDLAVLAGRDTMPNVTWFPVDALYRDFTLSSDKPDVARIADQKIRGIIPGHATITLHSLDGGHKAVFSATVLEGLPVVNTHSIAAEDMYLVRGAAAAVPTLHWLPENVTDKYYKLVSLDTNVVTILDKTQVYPKGAGTAQVYVIVLDGSGQTAVFGVFVADRAVPVTGIVAAPISLLAGADPVPPKLTWQPPDATNRKYYLTSGDSSSAVTQNGLIDPISMGNADFIVTTDDGAFKDTFTVSVGRPDTTNHVDSVAAADLSVPLGTDKKPAISWYPADAGNQTYSLSSQDTTIAQAAGEKVHPVKLGTTDFHLVSNDGGHTADFKVTVYLPEILVQSVTADTMYMLLDEERTPALAWSPNNATNLKYTLVSQDTAYASIVNGNTVHAKAVGYAKIQVIAADGPTSVFPVIISAKAVKLISMSCAPFNINLGDAPKDPQMAFNPATAANKAVTFKSLSGGNIISVNGQNKVVAVAAGKATLTAVSDENPNLTAECTVTVAALVKSIVAKDDTLRLGSAEKDVTPGLTWNPPNATDKSFALKSNDTSIVKINGKNYKGVGGGKTTVIVRALDGSNQADTFKVWVKIPVTGVVAKDYSMKTTDDLYGTSALFTLSPSNATDKTYFLRYTIPNATPAPSTVATIVNGWMLKPQGPGIISLTIVSSDNSAVKDTFSLTVIQPVTGISAAAASLKVGDADKDAVITIAPANASDKSFTLTSGNPSVASVVANKIHAVTGGTANFTAVSNYDASYSAAFTVTVSVPVISLSAADLNMKVGDPVRDPAITWNPSGATNKGYALASSNTSAVLITAAGKLQAVGAGNAIVTITSSDGAKTAAFAVAVAQPVVSLQAADLALKKQDGDKDAVLTWNPNNATNKGYTLAGGSAYVATVVNNRIHPIGAGSAGFTVTSLDGGKVAGFTVTVYIGVENISARDLDMRTGDANLDPDLTWTPADATNKGYILTSNDPGTASITSDGKIHAVSRGNAQITVQSSEDKSIQATFSVQVHGMFGP